MSRVTEARYTNPLTVTVRADEKALLHAYAESNDMTLTELVRAALAQMLGSVEPRTCKIIPVAARALVAPPTSSVRRKLAVEEARGEEMLLAKRARQRKTVDAAIGA